MDPIELSCAFQTDPTDKNMWQRNLYHKIGKAQMRDIDNMSQDAVIEKIAFMGQVLSILHMVSLFLTAVTLETDITV